VARKGGSKQVAGVNSTGKELLPVVKRRAKKVRATKEEPASNNEQ